MAGGEASLSIYGGGAESGRRSAGWSGSSSCIRRYGRRRARWSCGAGRSSAGAMSGICCSGSGWRCRCGSGRCWRGWRGWRGARRCRDRYTVRASLFICLFSFLQNYFGAPLFFRCFGMEYHFTVTWVGNGSPWFLSFMTVAYFSTYFALMQLGLRQADSVLRRVAGRRRRGALRVAVCLLLGYSMAFAETLTMANEWLRGYFAYADKTRMLVYGSLCYGTLLSIALPLYARLGEEDEAAPRPLSAVLWEVLGANMLVLICYELFAFFIARG